MTTTSSLPSRPVQQVHREGGQHPSQRPEHAGREHCRQWRHQAGLLCTCTLKVFAWTRQHLVVPSTSSRLTRTSWSPTTSWRRALCPVSRASVETSSSSSTLPRSGVVIPDQKLSGASLRLRCMHLDHTGESQIITFALYLSHYFGRFSILYAYK